MKEQLRALDQVLDPLYQEVEASLAENLHVAIAEVLALREKAAVKHAFDRIYEIAPGDMFMHWKPADIAKFFNGLRLIEIELTSWSKDEDVQR